MDNRSTFLYLMEIDSGLHLIISQASVLYHFILLNDTSRFAGLSTINNQQSTSIKIESERVECRLSIVIKRIEWCRTCLRKRIVKFEERCNGAGVPERVY